MSYKPEVLSLLSLTTLWVVLVATGASTDNDVTGCPTTCFCNVLSRIVYCSRRGLATIPEVLPTGALQLNLNGNHFRSRVLQQANFSSVNIETVEHLYLSDCGIRTIEVDTFANLKVLRWLDLSENRLVTVPDAAFRGLTLQHLFLNGNRDIQLVPGSFHGLATSGLYLHDCMLTELDPEVLAPLANGTLVNLWLNANRLMVIDRRLEPVFAALSHLRLGSNPLHCNCEALWLKELYDRDGGSVFRGAEPPSCSTPGRLRQRYFADVLAGEFRCRAPSFSNINALFDSDSARLSCSATGDPVPAVYWIRPSGKAVRYDPSTFDGDGTNEGLLVLEDLSKASAASAKASRQASVSGMYICVANNEVGNVTLTVNVTRPKKLNLVESSDNRTVVSASGLSKNSPPELQLLDAASGATVSKIDARKSPNSSSGGGRTNVDTVGYQVINVAAEPEVPARVNAERLFTGAEMAMAIVGTHLATLLCLAVTLLPVYWWRHRRQRRHLAESDRLGNALLEGREAAGRSVTSADPRSGISDAKLQQQQQFLWTHHQQQNGLGQSKTRQLVQR